MEYFFFHCREAFGEKSTRQVENRRSRKVSLLRKSTVWDKFFFFLKKTKKYFTGIFGCVEKMGRCVKLRIFT